MFTLSLFSLSLSLSLYLFIYLSISLTAYPCMKDTLFKAESVNIFYLSYFLCFLVCCLSRFMFVCFLYRHFVLFWLLFFLCFVLFSFWLVEFSVFVWIILFCFVGFFICLFCWISVNGMCVCVGGGGVAQLGQIKTQRPLCTSCRCMKTIFMAVFINSLTTASPITHYSVLKRLHCKPSHKNETIWVILIPFKQDLGGIYRFLSKICVHRV